MDPPGEGNQAPSDLHGLGGLPQRETEELGEEDRDGAVIVAVAVGARAADLLRLQVDLAERAGGHHALRAVSARGFEDGLRQFVPHLGVGGGEHSAATAHPLGEVDALRAESGEEVVEAHRPVAVVERRLRPHDLTPVIRCDLEPVEAPRRLAHHRFHADVVDDDVERMAHLDAEPVRKTAGGQRVAHGLPKLRHLPQVAVGLEQHRVAGAARRDQRKAGLLGQSEVAGGYRHRHRFLDRHVHGGPAAVPVLDLLQFVAQQRHHAPQRPIVGAGGSVQAAPGVVRELHAPPPITAGDSGRSVTTP